MDILEDSGAIVSKRKIDDAREALGFYAAANPLLAVPSVLSPEGMRTADWPAFLKEIRSLLGFAEDDWFVGLLGFPPIQTELEGLVKYRFDQISGSRKLLDTCLVIVVQQDWKVALIENSLSYSPHLQEASYGGFLAESVLGRDRFREQISQMEGWQIADRGQQPDDPPVEFMEPAYRSRGFLEGYDRETYELVRPARIAVLVDGFKKTVNVDTTYQAGGWKHVVRSISENRAGTSANVYVPDPFTASGGHLPGDWNQASFEEAYGNLRQNVMIAGLSVDTLSQTLVGPACTILNWSESDLVSLSGKPYSEGQLAAMVLYWIGELYSLLNSTYADFHNGSLTVTLRDPRCESVYDKSVRRSAGGKITFGGPHDDLVPDCLDGALVLHEYVHHLQNILGFKAPDHLEEGVADGIAKIFVERFSNGNFTSGVVFGFEQIQRAVACNRSYSNFSSVRGTYEAGSYWCECLWRIFYCWMQGGMARTKAAELLILAQVDALRIYANPANVRANPSLGNAQGLAAAVEGHMYLAGCLMSAVRERGATMEQMEQAFSVLESMQLIRNRR